MSCTRRGDRATVDSCCRSTISVATSPAPVHSTDSEPVTPSLPTTCRTGSRRERAGCERLRRATGGTARPGEPQRDEPRDRPGDEPGRLREQAEQVVLDDTQQDREACPPIEREHRRDAGDEGPAPSSLLRDEPHLPRRERDDHGERGDDPGREPVRTAQARQSTDRGDPGVGAGPFEQGEHDRDGRIAPGEPNGSTPQGDGQLGHPASLLRWGSVQSGCGATRMRLRTARA